MLALLNDNSPALVIVALALLALVTILCRAFLTYRLGMAVIKTSPSRDLARVLSAVKAAADITTRRRR